MSEQTTERSPLSDPETFYLELDPEDDEESEETAEDEDEGE